MKPLYICQRRQNVTDRDDENVLAAGVVLLIIVVMIVAGLVLIW